MKVLRVVLAMLIFAGTVGAYARAQEKVDQGKPGTQGPWPVTGQSPSFRPDGGATNGTAFAIYPYHCANTSPSTKVLCDGGVQTIGGGVDRLYTVVTNAGNDDGTGSGFVKCRPDAAPSLTAGTPGQGLTVGSSVTYTNSRGSAVRCICSSGYVGGYECVP